MTNMRRIAGAAALAAGFAVAGCGGSDDEADSASAEGGGKKVAYLSPVAAQPDQQEIADGMKRGAEHLGWTFRVLDANLSPDRQVANVDTAIAQKTDALGTWTLDPGATAGSYQRAVAAGIPVIGVNSEGEGVTGTVWEAVYTCNPGGPMEQVVDAISRQNPKASIVVMGGPPVPSIDNMTKCFTAAARKAGLNVAAEVKNTADSSAGARKLMEDLLTKNPEIDAAWTYNDASALGMSAALEARGKKIAGLEGPGAFVIGSGANAEGLAAIKAGKLTATWDYNTRAVGMAVIQQMQKGIEQGADKQLDPITIAATLVSKENVDGAADPDKYGFDDLPLVE